MEALHIQPLEEDRGLTEEQEKSGEQEEGGMECSSSTGSTTDEETDGDSEPEPPPVVRRKVSFADAFGLNLVSVKEFDNAEVTESEVSEPPERETATQLEEFYMSCLFTVPSSPEELDQRLQAETVALESIELLPGTSTLRGIIRVVNLCYSKSVYVRITLDRWNSYYDLLAEYVPGSSDRKTDRFTFMYTLLPPFEREGTRVEFCLCYDTSVGTFWANNKEMNYVLFCHQKGQGPHVLEESTGHKSKRSCLKANRRGSAEEKTRETINTATVTAEAKAPHEAEEAGRKTAEIQSLLHCEDHKPLVDSIKSQHRAARLAHVQDFQRRQQVPKPKPMPNTWDDSASPFQKHQKKPSNKSPQVLTYHQIPLFTLDWNNDKPQQWGIADDIWTGRAKMAFSKASDEHIKDKPSVNDTWETFHNGADHTTHQETPVCDIWQAFLNGPSSKDHSGVPESEWLQTAALVSPSKDKEPQTQHAASSQEHEFQVGTDTPTTFQPHTSAARQLLSGTRETSLANVALSVKDQQPAKACVSGPRDDNIATPDASQRSQTNSVADTPQEFSFTGAMRHVSGGSVDSSTEYHKHVIREQEREGIIGGAGGIGGDEPSATHTADLVTSSGESETTAMTAMPKSENASAGDRISWGAMLDEGLSFSKEGEVTGTAHKAMDDTLAFRETIRQGTKNGDRFVFSSCRQGMEEGITMNCMENKISTEVEIFRPECEISQGYADEKQCEEFRLNQNREKALKQNERDENEIRPARSHAYESNLNQTCEKNTWQSQIMASKSQFDEKDVASNNKDVGGFGQKEVETFHCATSEKTKRLIGEAEMIELLDEEEFQKEEEDPTQTQTNDALKSETGQCASVSSQTDKGISLSYSGLIQEKQVFQTDLDTFRPFPTDKYNLNLMGVRWTHSQEHMKGQKEHVGSEINPREVTAKENVAKKDTSIKLQHRPETLKRIEEDMSQRDRDERVSIGKLEIEAVGELLGNVENTQGENENAPSEEKEQELSAEVESSPRVEYRKSSEGTKDAITAENKVALDVMEPGLEEVFIDRFGEDLVRGIWEDVFSQRDNVQAFNRDTNIVGGVEGELTDILDTRHDCHLPSEKNSNDDFDSGVFSLTELPADPNLSFGQGLEQTLADRSDTFTPSGTEQPLAAIEQIHFKPETDSDSSARLSQDLDPTLARHRRQSSSESAQTLGSPKDQGNYSQKIRSVTLQETGRQIEDCVLARRESFNQSIHPSPKYSSSSSKKLKESDSLLWWTILYILSHITRGLLCALVVGGFFVVVFLFDLPAFFVLYIFSLCWWFCKRKRHQGTTNEVG